MALDVNEEDQSGLREVADLAQSLHARVNLLYVVVNGDTSPDTAIEKMHDLALSCTKWLITPLASLAALHLRRELRALSEKPPPI
ncbi:MAG: hypothetical protein LC643_06255 [Bacteroidales bacterium]|nr:hypothetical protein [Bacteroidales bacterium]